MEKRQCDKCKSINCIGTTEQFTFLACFWVGQRTVELCPQCAKDLRHLIKKFLKQKIPETEHEHKFETIYDSDNGLHYGKCQCGTYRYGGVNYKEVAALVRSARFGG